MAKKKKQKNDWKHLISAGSIVVAVVGTLIIAWALQSEPSDRQDRMVIENPMPDHQFPSPLPPQEVESADELEPAGESAHAAATEPQRDADDANRPQAEAEPAPEPAVERPATLSADLHQRAKEDLARMKAAGSGYTLQFASLCNSDSVKSALQRLYGYENFYLIPVTSGERRCHRLCWGIYPSREGALAARGIPGAMRAIEKSPLPKALDKVVR
jgi:septal ring-binding cell division protein DamX